jgi:hypothetical protein
MELLAAYLDWATAYYVKNGEPTSEVFSIKATIRKICELYGSEDIYASAIVDCRRTEPH